MAQPKSTKKAPGSLVRGKRAAKSATRTARHRPDAELDFADIPELTDSQLQRARRVGRPSHGAAPKQLIAIRVDPGVLAALRRLAHRQKIGYQTLIQKVLAEAVAPRSPA